MTCAISRIQVSRLQVHLSLSCWRNREESKGLVMPLISDINAPNQAPGQIEGKGRLLYSAFMTFVHICDY